MCLKKFWNVNFLNRTHHFFCSHELCCLEGAFPAALKPSPAGQQS